MIGKKKSIGKLVQTSKEFVDGKWQKVGFYVDRQKNVTIAFGPKKIRLGVCSICGDLYSGHGNNAEPVNSGRCCSECNSTVVIKARLNFTRTK